MMQKNKLELKKVFSGLQKQMESQLTLNREILLHPVEKGDASELEWINMLSTYLPKRYSVSKAHIIDYEGSYSQQIDIVIYDSHYSPFILKQNGATYIPAECVYAVIEVKQDLSLQNLKYASKKVSSVRKLKRTSAKIIQADGRDFDPKTPPKILSGLLTIGGTLTNNMMDYIKNLKANDCLNFGCALSGIYFKTKNYHPWQHITPPYSLEIKKGSKSLLLFFMNMLTELQKMGTVPAIELGKYIKQI
jgi:Domain of unknown function (DUF6602)